MSPEQRQVKDFHEKFGIHMPKLPTMPPHDRLAYRQSHLDEESQELSEAILSNDFLGMVQELCDVLYVAFGLACEMGIDLEPYFTEVHKANMRKQGGARRQDGKILKPVGWMPPDLGAILSEQRNKAT